MTFSLSHKMRIAVGVSGGGRSLANLLEKQATLPFEVVLVFSSAPDLGANEIARRAGLPLLVEDFGLKNRDAARASLYAVLREHRVDLMVLAGFLKLLPIDPAWHGKIINIHPALLPQFGGKGMHGSRVHEAVLAAKAKTSGATVHFVNEKYDDGAIIARAEVPVLASDSPDALASRVFATECELLPWAISQMAKGELPADGIVHFDPKVRGA